MIVEHKLFRISMLEKAHSFFYSILKFIHTTVNRLHYTDVNMKVRQNFEMHSTS